MASIFGHALAAVAIGKTYSQKHTTFKFLLLGSICAIIPDADVVMFKFGIPYDHFLGHRGFSHSLVFALLLALMVTGIFYRKTALTNWQRLSYVLFFFLAAASHVFLDAMTTGGLGVAAFAPFDNSRYFLPWRPIKVSPIGVHHFFSVWGLRVIKSELVFIGIPSVGYIFLTKSFRSKKKVE